MELLNSQKTMNYHHEIKSFENVSSEFPLEQKAIILGNDKYDGCQCIIKSIKDEDSEKSATVVVQPILKPFRLNNKNCDYFHKDSTIYFELGLIAKKLGTTEDTVLAILDSVFIQVDHHLPSSFKLDEFMDVGLNLINR